MQYALYLHLATCQGGGGGVTEAMVSGPLMKEGGEETSEIHVRVYRRSIVTCLAMYAH